MAAIALASGLAIGHWGSTTRQVRVDTTADASGQLDELLRSQKVSAVALGALSQRVEALGRATNQGGAASPPAPATAASEAEAAAAGEDDADHGARVETARAIITGAIDAGGTWTADKGLELRQALAGAGAEAPELMRELAMAFNTGKLRPSLDDGRPPI